jgi:hypothetical protein
MMIYIRKKNSFKLCHNEVFLDREKAQQITSCLCLKVEKEFE